jgi:hypothetical protein
MMLRIYPVSKRAPNAQEPPARLLNALRKSKRALRCALTFSKRASNAHRGQAGQ